LGCGGRALTTQSEIDGQEEEERPITKIVAVTKPTRRVGERIVQSSLVQPAAGRTRPMLSRVAEAMYWMSRYVERAEHIARIVLVNSHMLIDLGELDQDMQEKQWLGVLRILRLDQRAEVQESLLAGKPLIGQHVSDFMANESNRSLISALTKARENARSIRENISTEMWETLNTLYWSLLGDDVKQRFEECPEEVFHSVIMGSLLFQGVSDQTLPHSQSWQFIQLAKYLERADMICRIVDTNFDILQSSGDFCETPLRNIQWMGVLRSCCSIEAYRRKYLGDLDPLNLAAFLLLDAESPRNVRYSVKAAQEAIAGIASSVHPLEIDTAERVLGRLCARLEYAEMSEILKDGLPHYLQSLQQRIAEAAAAVQQGYFLY